MVFRKGAAPSASWNSCNSASAEHSDLTGSISAPVPEVKVIVGFSGAGQAMGQYDVDSATLILLPGVNRWPASHN